MSQRHESRAETREELRRQGWKTTNDIRWDWLLGGRCIIDAFWGFFVPLLFFEAICLGVAFGMSHDPTYSIAALHHFVWLAMVIVSPAVAFGCMLVWLIWHWLDPI